MEVHLAPAPVSDSVTPTDHLEGGRIEGRLKGKEQRLDLLWFASPHLATEPQLDEVAPVCNFGIQEAKAGGSGVLGQPGPRHEFWVRIRPPLPESY